MLETPSPPEEESRDRLTIRRLMLLTAGVAVGLTLFAPRVGECLYFVIPNLALWCLLAAILTGRAHQVFGRQTPGTERYGLLLAMLWSPLGVWHLIGIYRDVL